MWFFRTFLSFSLCLLLAGCGFHPLHEPNVGPNICYPVKIATISGRNGQILRNYLLDLLTPGGAPQHPRYHLEVVLTDTIKTLTVKRDEITSRKEADLTAKIALRDLKTNKIIYTHSAIAINSYPVLSQNYFSDLVAEDYAKKEASRLLAEKITLLLTTYIDSLE